MRETIIGKNDAGQRIDKFLTKKYKTLPVSMMYKLIRKKKITVNRKRVREDYVLCEGDKILIFAPDDLFEERQKRPVSDICADVHVVYEDENILIADKPSGLLVHADESDNRDTLIDRIQAYLFRKGEYDPANEQSFAPALCNRIDRNTRGLVIAAKNAAALRSMNEIIRSRKAEKTYLAAIHGLTDAPNGIIRLYLEKDCSTNTVHVRKSRTGSETKTAVTEYKTVAVNGDKTLSLMEIKLVTGRTHQIRASFAHIGHPLLGDGKYAVNKADREMGFSSQALCSYSLAFAGIPSGDMLSYLNGKTFYAEKPDFLKLFK